MIKTTGTLIRWPEPMGGNGADADDNGLASSVEQKEHRLQEFVLPCE